MLVRGLWTIVLIGVVVGVRAGPSRRTAPPVNNGPKTAYHSKVFPPAATANGADLFPKRRLPKKIYSSPLSNHHHIQHKLKVDDRGRPILQSNDGFEPPMHRWRFPANQPLTVHFNADQSDMDARLVRRVLEESYNVWRDVPGVALPQLVLVETKTMIPSSYVSGSENGLNEIGFRNLTVLSSNPYWLTEKWKWSGRDDDSVLVEVDTVFESRHRWACHGHQHGDANQWKEMGEHAFDFRNAAVTHWGEFLGFPHSTNVGHSMVGLCAKGQVHKFSLEAGDRAIVRHSYPSS